MPVSSDLFGHFFLQNSKYILFFMNFIGNILKLLGDNYGGINPNYGSNFQYELKLILGI